MMVQLYSLQCLGVWMYFTLVLLDRNHANLGVGWFRTGIGMYCCSKREHLILLFQHYVKFSQIILL